MREKQIIRLGLVAGVLILIGGIAFRVWLYHQCIDNGLTAAYCFWRQ